MYSQGSLILVSDITQVIDTLIRVVESDTNLLQCTLCLSNELLSLL